LLVECEKTLDDASTVQRFDNESRAVHPWRAAGTCDDVELLREFHIITPAPGQMAPRPAKAGQHFTRTTPDRSFEFADYLLEIAANCTAAGAVRKNGLKRSASMASGTPGPESRISNVTSR
jgi:hypothetical protein